LNPGIRPRVKELLEKARRAGVTMVYDPNFRSTHLKKREELLSVIRENMEYATIVRASDDDLVNLFRVDNPDQAWQHVRPHSSILIYTATDVVHLRSETVRVSVKVDPIQPVSTIGAGDTFNAGILYGLSRNDYGRDQILDLGQTSWEVLIRGAIRFSREVCLSYDNYLPRDIAEKVKEEYKSWKREN
jgi:fructokinase